MARQQVRAVLLASTLFLLLPALAPEVSGASVEDLLRSGRSLLEAGRAEEALALARDLTTAAPNNAAAYRLLTACYQTKGQQDEAISAAAKAVSLDPNHAGARKVLETLCIEGLPRHGVTETFDALRRLVFAGSWEAQYLETDINSACYPSVANGLRRSFYTKGRLFSPSVPMQDPLRRACTLRKAEDLTINTFNRVVYGYVWEDIRSQWALKFRLYYPSTFVALGSRDYLPVAGNVLATMLNLYWLYKEALGCETRFGDGGVTDLWLCEDGSPGAEQPTEAPGSVYFNDVNFVRSPFEWLRECAHEYGHLALPAFSGFTQYKEPLVNGDLGEALALTWWARALSRHPSIQPPGFAVGVTDLQSYVATRCIPAAEAFAREASVPNLQWDQSEKGVQYLLGMVLHTEATLGSSALRRVLEGASLRGANLSTANAYESLLKTLADVPQTGLMLYPALSADESETTTEAKVDQYLGLGLGVPLKQGDTVRVRHYSPEGSWVMAVCGSVAARGVLGVTLEPNFQEQAVVVPPDQSRVVALHLKRLPAGWRTVKLRVVNLEGKMTLLGIEVVRLVEEPPLPAKQP